MHPVRAPGPGATPVTVEMEDEDEDAGAAGAAPEPDAALDSARVPPDEAEVVLVLVVHAPVPTAEKHSLSFVSNSQQPTVAHCRSLNPLFSHASSPFFFAFASVSAAASSRVLIQSRSTTGSSHSTIMVEFVLS